MRIAVCLFLVAAFAGCSDAAGGDETADQTNFDDVQVTVSDTTGAILGVVVNDAIIPIEGATVSVLNTDFTGTTDAEGRFAFSNVPAGTYFLEATKPLHDPVQSSVDVVAGVEKPGFVKIQLNRLFEGEPYIVTIPNEGFFTCSQAGTIVWGYTSSPCHSLGWGGGVDLCDEAGACLDQTRVFHQNVDAGWQTMTFEMRWEPSAYGTSERMGMSVSTYHPERNKNHWFASVSTTSPMHFVIHTGEMHATAQEGSGPDGPIPADGMTDMSTYMSVRTPESCTVYCPGFAVDQSFESWVTQAYYQPLPEDWSFIRGDPKPF